MKRFEFIMNEAVAEDFLYLCKKYNVGKNYTRIDNIKGCGIQNPKMGDDVWPQFNTMFIVVEEESNSEKFEDIARAIRKEFPKDGFFCNVCDCNVL